MGELDSKVAVITGGTRGLGLAIAKAYVQAGACVVVASRSQKSVDEAVAALTAQGGHACGMAVDVADLAQVEALGKLAVSTYGKMDIWVNNAAAAGPYGPTIQFTPQEFYQVVQTNIIGVYNGSRTAVSHFLRQGSGKLINIVGAGYKSPAPWQNAYGSSKAWISMFTRALAEETKGSGIGVFAFQPGMVLTELLTDVQVIEGSEDRMRVFPTVVRILAKPAEIPAKKMVWIASKDTDGKTGLTVSIFSMRAMLGGAIKEGIRALLHKPAPDMGIKLSSKPPYEGE
jgi:NAD(P)-dependent dehydrogenase (short-subunit alcohol dehydrogenase family)